MNARAAYLLSELRTAAGERLTLQRLALELSCRTHGHLSQVLDNKPGRGGQTRRKVIAYLIQRGPAERVDELLQELRWDRSGRVLAEDVPRETLHV